MQVTTLFVTRSHLFGNRTFGNVDNAIIERLQFRLIIGKYIGYLQRIVAFGFNSCFYFTAERQTFVILQPCFCSKCLYFSHRYVFLFV